MEHHGRKLLVEMKRNYTRTAALIFSFLPPGKKLEKPKALGLVWN
jgi:hypothetical protein